jgi:cytochrome c-type biogenesis protein
MGALLVAFAVLIATNTINYIANWMVMFWPQIG